MCQLKYFQWYHNRPDMAKRSALTIVLNKLIWVVCFQGRREGPQSRLRILYYADGEHDLSMRR